MKIMDNPNEINDRLIEESRILSKMENSICKSLRLYGYEKISTPVIEYYDMFSTKEFSTKEESIYKFIDRDGSIMALRPDMTIPCARIAATKMKNYSKPLKLFYIGNVYRVEGDGARRELTQIGAEIYGESGIWSDLETILTCCHCIKQSGIDHFKIDIGHGGFFDGISKVAALSEDMEIKLRKLINEKNSVELQNMLESLDLDRNSKQLFLELPHIFGSPDQTFRNIEKYNLDIKTKESVHYLKLLYEKLKDTPYKDHINIDMSMASTMKYYTGMIFKGYASGAGGVILSGGRYDTLTSIFNVDDQAVGFALYMDQIFSAYKNQDITTSKVEKNLILFDEQNYEKAVIFAKERRGKKEISSLIHIKSLSNEESYKKDYGFTKIIKFIEEGGKKKC